MDEFGDSRLQTGKRQPDLGILIISYLYKGKFPILQLDIIDLRQKSTTVVSA
jgi:hypothetical protein